MGDPVHLRPVFHCGTAGLLGFNSLFCCVMHREDGESSHNGCPGGSGPHFGRNPYLKVESGVLQLPNRFLPHRGSRGLQHRRQAWR